MCKIAKYEQNVNNASSLKLEVLLFLMLHNLKLAKTIVLPN